MTPAFTIGWLFFWVVSDAPDLEVSAANGWAVALAVCVVIDILDAIGRRRGDS